MISPRTEEDLRHHRVVVLPGRLWDSFQTSLQSKSLDFATNQGLG